MIFFIPTICFWIFPECLWPAWTMWTFYFEVAHLPSLVAAFWLESLCSHLISLDAPLFTPQQESVPVLFFLLFFLQPPNCIRACLCVSVALGWVCRAVRMIVIWSNPTLNYNCVVSLQRVGMLVWGEMHFCIFNTLNFLIKAQIILFVEIQQLYIFLYSPSLVIPSLLFTFTSVAI